eukprot:CAMPEP_0117463918 /NCGR_PEP_ID=MMETSP0784-20121206/3830_1 /TAXON_ID=39447 /ORGANISM="" /LENGTH=295 /DNA_ID=CAMNT_0005257755 /DNA_START=181 /DNA_END=1069 /DNA_ORIENTATION=+
MQNHFPGPRLTFNPVEALREATSMGPFLKDLDPRYQSKDMPNRIPPLPEIPFKPVDPSKAIQPENYNTMFTPGEPHYKITPYLQTYGKKQPWPWYPWRGWPFRTTVDDYKMMRLCCLFPLPGNCFNVDDTHVTIRSVGLMLVVLASCSSAPATSTKKRLGVKRRRTAQRGVEWRDGAPSYSKETLPATGAAAAQVPAAPFTASILAVPPPTAKVGAEEALLSLPMLVVARLRCPRHGAVPADLISTISCETRLATPRAASSGDTSFSGPFHAQCRILRSGVCDATPLDPPNSGLI